MILEWLNRKGIDPSDIEQIDRELKRSVGKCKMRNRYKEAFDDGKGWFDGTYHDFLHMIRNLIMQNA